MLRGRGVPNRLRPGGGRIPDTIEILDDFVSGFGRPIADSRSSPPSLPDLPPLAPRIVPGLGDPNTLKLYILYLP